MPESQDPRFDREANMPQKQRMPEEAEQGRKPEAGEIKDKEAGTSDSYGDTRDTGGGEQ